MAFHRWHRLAVLAGSLFLAGCSSFVSPGVPHARAVDYLRDDVPDMLIALELPASLEPQPTGSVLRLDMKAAGGSYRHIEATLVRADAGDLAGKLPPPDRGRTYYLYGFSPADQNAIRDAQGWARGLPAGYLPAGAVTVTLEPRVCATEPVDARIIAFSVLLAVPNAPAVSPLLTGKTLADALAPFGGGAVMPCTGHSG